MHLYLVRHADAIPLGETDAEQDEDRALSDKGVQQAVLLGGALQRWGVAPDQVLTSPARRARQTAEELVQRLELSGVEIVSCEALAPGTSPKKLARELLTVEGENILLVGHDPEMSRCAAWLIGCKDAQLEFAKGAVACVECEGTPRKGGGTLLWLVTPRLLKALAPPA